jgi:hypothetical protein
MGTRRAYVAATAAPLAVALQVPQPRHRERRDKKGLFGLNCFVDGLFFEIVSSLG